MIDTNIMRDEMENASVWSSEERVSMTELAFILTQVDNECFQVCFNCKANEKSVMERLSTVKSKPKGSAAK